MSRWLWLGFGVQSMVLVLLLTLALDVYAHKRVEHLGGVNLWGYRGATMPMKRANEVRLGVVGGTMAFGWGVAAEESMITTVRRLVSLEFDRPGRPATYVTGLNLALPGLTHAEYADRMRKYADLEFDVVCIYPDPASLAAPRTLVPKESGIEALTGYTPILPLVLEEKGVPVVGRVLRGADAAAYAIVARRVSRSIDPVDAVLETTASALAAARGVVVVLPAPPRGLASGFDELAGRLTARFGSDPRVRVVDSARDERLQDDQLRLDGVSFGAGGNALVGEVASPAVIEILRATGVRS